MFLLQRKGQIPRDQFPGNFVVASLTCWRQVRNLSPACPGTLATENGIVEFGVKATVHITHLTSRHLTSLYFN